MSGSYWPWWVGAVALALIVVNYTLVTDRSFGVSSAWDRVLHWRRERRLEREEEQFGDEQALVDALAAATAEQFGSPSPAPTAAVSPTAPVSPAAPPVPATTAAPRGRATAGGGDAGSRPGRSRQAPLVTQAALLVSIFLGALIASTASGRFEVRFDMGPDFARLVTADPLVMVGLLFAGGILVGFGTRLAGGCSSGHGLSGCGRLQPVSLLATAVFFGTAAAVSFLFWKVI